MVWVKIDDHFDEHPKTAQINDHAFALYICGLAYCNRNLTDGFIPAAVGAGQLRWCAGEVVPAIRQLERVGMWEEVEGGWQVHDFDDYQPSKATVEAERAKTAERVQRWRNGKRNAVTNPVTNAVGDGVGTPSPVPVPIPLVTASAMTNTNRELNGRAALIMEACTLIADRRPNRGDNPTAYRNAAIKGLTTDHLAHANQLLAATPTLTAAALADLLEPPSPHDLEARAKQALYDRTDRRREGEACGDCNDTGFLLTGEVAIRCTCQNDEP